MPTTQDILQRILLEGTQSITKQLSELGSAGEAAFTAIGLAASKVSAPFTRFERDLTKVEAAAKQTGSGLRTAADGAASFGTRIAATGAAVAGAGAFIFAGALKITTALRSIRDGLVEQRLAASQNAGIQKKNIQTDFAQANALQDLHREVVKGKISYEEYTAQLTELTFQQERQRRQQVQLEAEQENIRKEQAKDTAAAQRRAQQLRLEAQFGSSLATTLERLAAVLETVRDRFFAAFGPRISEFLLSIGNALNNNVERFIALFDQLAKGVADAFGKSKVTVDGVIKSLAQFGTDIVKAITSVVIPALLLMLSVIQKIADLINATFGTNFTASALIAAAIVIKLTGLFGVLQGAVVLVIGAVRLLFATFGPLGIIIGVIVALIATQLIPLLSTIDWGKIAATALAAWNSIRDAVVTALTTIKDTWNAIVAFFDQKIKAIIGFFDNLIRKVKELLGLTGSSANSKLSQDAGIGDIGGFAKGGLFRGRGGKDTNLAWLTDREFIINPAATKFWGTDILHAINSMANPFRGFNAGGLVGAMMQSPSIPRFAEGGLNATPTRPLTLVIGDQEFAGLTVQDDTADNMARYAARRGVRQAGRRPVWFGGSRRG